MNVPPVQTEVGLNVIVPGVFGIVPTVIFRVRAELVPQALVAVTETGKMPDMVPALVTERVLVLLPSSVILAGVVQL